jgi:glycosyltransferase involved in cell wall biosynthesis
MIEAMSMAKPVVAFDLPFARELVGTTGSKLLGNGLHGFASVLWDLIDSKEHRVKMGRLLRSNARRFDSGKIASEYHSIYRELI